MKFTGKILFTLALLGTLHTVQGSTTVTVSPTVPSQGVYPQQGPTKVVQNYVGQITPEVGGIIIYNKNNYPVSYSINHYWFGNCIPYSISEGELSGNNGFMSFSGGLFSTPKHVCVHIKGQTSIFGRGGWTHVTNKDGCVITVTNAGFLRGINLDYSAGCQADGASAPVSLRN